MSKYKIGLSIMIVLVMITIIIVMIGDNPTSMTSIATYILQAIIGIVTIIFINSIDNLSCETSKVQHTPKEQIEGLSDNTPKEPALINPDEEEKETTSKIWQLPEKAYPLITKPSSEQIDITRSPEKKNNDPLFPLYGSDDSGASGGLVDFDDYFSH